MAKREKLLIRAMSNPKGLSFSEFQTLLRQTGWTLDHQKAVTGFGIRRQVIGSLFRRAGAERQRAIRSNNF